MSSQTVEQLKGQNRVTFVAVDGILTYVSYYNSPYHLTLRMLHKYPETGIFVTVDGGAFKAMLNNAQLMAPGI